MRIDSTHHHGTPSCHAACASTSREGTTPFAQVLRPEVHTPLSGDEAFEQLKSAWTHVTGTAPNDKALSILWAQWAMETARGTKMYGHNFSGIKGFGPSGLSLMLRTSEGHGPSRQSLRDRFRAYVDPAEGATDYVRLLRDRYPAALEAAVRGDATGFVHEIRRRGYFTDEEKKYARAISSLAKERAHSPSELQVAERRDPVPRVSEASATAVLDALWWATRRWEGVP